MIQPALTPDEWADVNLDDQGNPSHAPSPELVYEVAYLWGKQRPHACIAICNAALPDSDRRKITRETVVDLRDIARRLDDSTEPGMHGASGLLALADALESYLPPEV